MKVLWFSTNSSAFKYDNKPISTYGSWTISLQQELVKHKEVSLGICFCMDGQPQKVEQEGVLYYPISNHVKSWTDKVLDLFLFRDITRDRVVWQYYIEQFQNVIDDFQPDVVQVFGSELYVGLATFATRKPLVLHIQGILNTCLETYFPPGISKKDYIWQDLNPFHAWKRYYNYVWWLRNCYRERKIIQQTRHFIGRTDWDKRVIHVLNPNAIYHFGEEIMRPIFYSAGQRELPEDLIINTTISLPFYKGFDLILKTANILKNYLHRCFIWNVYGAVEPTFTEKELGVCHKNLNIVLQGVVTADVLCTSHLHSTVYVHSSYIENGCNAIIEAQMCGCSVIANYIGGLDTTIKNGNTGFLVPANDPYQTAYLIDYLFTHPNENLSMGKRAAADALQRHDKEKIVNELLSTYRELLS